MAAADGDSLLLRLAEWAVSAIGGALVVLVAFRTKLALIDQAIEERKREITTETVERKALESRIEERLDRIERRSIELLRITADIARKVDADHRFSDSVIRMLADDNA